MNIDPQLATIAAILAFILPPIIAAINRRTWSSEVKGVCAFVVCAMASLAAVWWQGDWETDDIRNTALIVFGGAIFFYNNYWKPSNIAPKIEDKTG